MKKSALLLITTLLMPMFLSINVYGAEISGTITEVLIPTQDADRSGELFIPVDDCKLVQSTDYCEYSIKLNGTLVSTVKVNGSTLKKNDDKYYQLVFDYSRARDKGRKNDIVITTGVETLTSYSYTPKESTISETCSSEVKLTTERGIILTRKVKDNDVEEYEELINFITPIGDYDVIAGTGVELPVWIYYTYQGTDKNGGSVLDYYSLVEENNPLSLYTGYLPDKVNNYYPSEDSLYKVPYDTTYHEILDDEIYIQTDDDESYTTNYYTDAEAVANGLLAAGYEKVESSKRTEYKWYKESEESVEQYTNATSSRQDCSIYNNGESHSTCHYYQYKPIDPEYTCVVYYSGPYSPPKRYYASDGAVFKVYPLYGYSTSCEYSNYACRFGLLEQCKREKANDWIGCYIKYETYSYSGSYYSTRKEVDSSQDNGCTGNEVVKECKYYCSYDELTNVIYYYNGSGVWFEDIASAIWTIEEPEDRIELDTRETYRYYKSPSGDFNYQITELAKYELPETYIEIGTNDVYVKAEISGKNVIGGGRRIYTDIQAEDSILSLNAFGENIGINKYKYDLSCDFNILSNGMYNGAGNTIIYRPVDPTDPFPEYDPLANWQGKETLITDKGYGVYSLTPEYQISLTSLDIKNIKSYNDLHDYLDYNFDSSGENIFIHKMFSGLFKVNKKVIK